MSLKPCRERQGRRKFLIGGNTRGFGLFFSCQCLRNDRLYARLRSRLYYFKWFVYFHFTGKILATLGEGTFGKVLKVKDMDNP